jgi:hypothetical protein
MTCRSAAHANGPTTPLKGTAAACCRLEPPEGRLVPPPFERSTAMKHLCSCCTARTRPAAGAGAVNLI